MTDRKTQLSSKHDVTYSATPQLPAEIRAFITSHLDFNRAMRSLPKSTSPDIKNQLCYALVKRDYPEKLQDLKFNPKMNYYEIYKKADIKNYKDLPSEVASLFRYAAVNDVASIGKMFKNKKLSALPADLRKLNHYVNNKIENLSCIASRHHAQAVLNYVYSLLKALQLNEQDLLRLSAEYNQPDEVKILIAKKIPINAQNTRVCLQFTLVTTKIHMPLQS